MLMFHRVLPRDLITAYQADPEYTISTALLEQLIAFVTYHYNIVNLDDVVQSRAKTKPLPPYPLLITFDDGWDDNARFAANIFAKDDVPWTLFAATDAISSGDRWWQEDLLSILRANDSAFEALKTAAMEVLSGTVSDLPTDRALAILLLYGSLSPDKRDELIAPYSNRSTRRLGSRDMVDWETLEQLQEQGVDIAGHGASHLPLTMIEDPAGDLQKAQHELRRHLGDQACTAMSFPHGRYNPEIVKHASNLGMRLMFTSDPLLNLCPGGWLDSDLIGRIPVSTSTVARADGLLELERVMPWLILRDERQLVGI